MNLTSFFGNSSRISSENVSYSLNEYYSSSSSYAISILQCNKRITYYNSQTLDYEFSLLLFDVKSEQKQSIVIAEHSVKNNTNNFIDF